MKTHKIILILIIILNLNIISGFNFEGRAGTIETTTGNLTRFTELIDTPSSYTGEGGSCAKVNVGENALEFSACGSITESDPVWTGNYSIFTGLIDNSSYLSTFNQTYNDYSLNVSTNWTLRTYNLWNTDWLSTYNKTYDNYALNVSTNWTERTQGIYGGWWYNQTQAIFAEPLLNETIDARSVGNLSFNETYADTLYSNVQWDYNQTTPATAYADANMTFDVLYNLLSNSTNWVLNFTELYSLDWSNITILESQISDLSHVGNVSWNESFADTLYSNVQWDHNQTTPATAYADANMTVAVLQGILNTTEIYSGNCSVAGTCNIAYLDYDNTGNLNLTGDVNITGDLNVAGTSYLGDLIISAENITVDNLIPLSGGEVNITGNLTLWDKITFGLGEIIDNLVDGWITITGGLEVTGAINSSDWSNATITESQVSDLQTYAVNNSAGWLLNFTDIHSNDWTNISGLTDAQVSDTLTCSILNAGTDADLNDNDILDVDDIGSTTDEIDDIYIGTNQKIYLGDGQEASIFFNGSGILFEVQ